MAYWDASAIVPLCVYQPATGALGRLVRKHGRLVVWWGTTVEVRSALSRLVCFDRRLAEVAARVGFAVIAGVPERSGGEHS